jgi:hypothetical protein
MFGKTTFSVLSSIVTNYICANSDLSLISINNNNIFLWLSEIEKEPLKCDQSIIKKLKTGREEIEYVVQERLKWSKMGSD